MFCCFRGGASSSSYVKKPVADQAEEAPVTGSTLTGSEEECAFSEYMSCESSQSHFSEPGEGHEEAGPRETAAAVHHHHRHHHHHHHRQSLERHHHHHSATSEPSTSQPSAKIKPGCTLKERGLGVSPLEARMMFEPSDGTRHRVRGLNYRADKIKELSSPSIYRLVTADFFNFDKKVEHVARHIDLPEPCSVVDAGGLPPLLVLQIQMPHAPPSMFSSTPDGKGVVFVAYFTLPEGFDAKAFPNQKALALATRWAQDGREADGGSSRDRLKVIPALLNLLEWHQGGHVSHTEFELLRSYDQKPFMARPQHRYFSGTSAAGAAYLEVDLDAFEFRYPARAALKSFLPRLQHSVWDWGLVVQGNGPEELPENMLCAGLIWRLDFVAGTGVHLPVPAPAGAVQA